MKILGTGLTGLVGSRIVELLGDRYEFESSDTRITDKEGIENRISSSDAPVVFNLAAKTDVDGCEKDKDAGVDGDAWKVNVAGTQNVADACSEAGKRLIYISTDFVFDGENPPAGGYTEEDIPNPINWYAQTKYEGEKIVKSLDSPWLIVRIAYPYRAAFPKNDFARAILGRLSNGQSVAAVTDHVFVPTFIDDIAYALDALIKNDATGIYHVVGGQSLSPYDAAGIIADTFGLDKSQITKTTRDEFFKDRANRPYRLALKHDKIDELGIKMKTFKEGMEEIKYQIANIK